MKHKFKFETGGYIVGYDTLGDGILIDSCPYICHNETELCDQILRVIDQNELGRLANVSLEEQVVIFKAIETPKFQIVEREEKTIVKDLKFV